MELIGIILLAIAVIVLIIRTVRGGARMDERTRRTLLLEEAHRRWPNLKAVQAVDLLYVDRIREIKRAAKAGRPFDAIVEMEEDVVMLMNERSRLLQEEVDEESSYDVAPFQKRYLTGSLTSTSEVHDVRNQRHT